MRGEREEILVHYSINVSQQLLTKLLPKNQEYIQQKTLSTPWLSHLSQRISHFQCVMHNLIITTVRISPRSPPALYTQINKLGILLFPTDVVFAANTQDSETLNRFIMEVNWYPILTSQSKPLARNRCRNFVTEDFFSHFLCLKHKVFKAYDMT